MPVDSGIITVRGDLRVSIEPGVTILGSGDSGAVDFIYTGQQGVIALRRLAEVASALAVSLGERV